MNLSDDSKSKTDDSNVDEQTAIVRSLFEYEVPPHLHAGIVRYLLLGIRPGGFLCAVIGNQLWGAACLSSSHNFFELFALSKWLLNEGPEEACGSPAKMDRWIKNKHEARETAQ